MNKNLIALALVLGILLSGCAHLLPGKSNLPTVVATAPAAEMPVATAPTASVREEPTPGQDARLSAFRSALQTIHDELYFPVLEEEIVPWGTIENTLFAIADFDGDGEDELAVTMSDTFVAGMVEVIYGFHPETGSLYTELTAFPALTFYPGLIKEGISHNQGLAGDALWPYFVHRYNPDTDTYDEIAFVDAWSKEYAPEDYAGKPFPDELDTDHVGAVYMITENNQTHTVCYSDYLAWEAELFAELDELDIWMFNQQLTNANIAAATGGEALPVPELPVCGDYLWDGQLRQVMALVTPRGLEITDSGSGEVLVTAEIPAQLGVIMYASYCFDDLTDDGYSDIQADFTLKSREAANILWLSDGQTLYYNEEFSLLPGQISPRGED